MATASKSNVKKNPALTKTGKVKLTQFTITQLVEMSEKTQRPRDKDKIQRRIKYLQSKL